MGQCPCTSVKQTNPKPRSKSSTHVTKSVNAHVHHPKNTSSKHSLENSYHNNNNKDHSFSSSRNNRLSTSPSNSFFQRNTNTNRRGRNFSSSERSFTVNSEILVNRNHNSQKDSYKILEKLGEGSYGVVWKVKQRKSNLIRAMKKITKNMNSKNDTVNEIINEIEVLKKIDHPNIVKIFEFFIEVDGYYLITEYCGGGELFDAIKKNGSFSEPVAANIMYQIFNAINYCHSTNHIIHRDLKPENILIDSKDEQTGFYSIKIIDFGTAKIYEKNKNENKIIGSSYYIAPEVLMKNYNEKCDIWSCGVILYILLSGRAPFTGHKDREVLQKIKQGRYDLKRKPFDNTSVEAKDLIKRSLEMNKNKRINAKDALNHPWFIKHNTKDYFCKVNDRFLRKTIDNISHYKPKNKLQQITIAYLVHNLPELEEIKLINKVFALFNTSNNGKLSKEETKRGLMKYMSHNLKNKAQIEQYTEEIFKRIDNDENGFIECEEFARAGIDKNIFRASNILKFTFDYLDKDKSGQITIDELKEVFKISNPEDENELWDLIRSVDQDCNGQISFKEYKDVMIKIIE